MKYDFNTEKGQFFLYDPETGKEWSNFLFNDMGYICTVAHTGATSSRYLNADAISIAYNDGQSFFYVRDEENKKFWNIGGYPTIAPIHEYCCEHAQTYTKISSVTEEMTPDEGGQIVLVSRETGSQRLVMANALLGYTTQEGKRFQIEYKYDVDSRYLQEKEYILSTEYDDCYVYTTRDQVEVLIEKYDGQIWASAVNAETGNAVYFYTTGCTAKEMETILDSLHLASAMQAGT